MSCNEWERGTVKIPSKDWAGLKKKIRDAHNDKQELGYQLAIALYYHLKEELKGKRNQNALYNDVLSKADEEGFYLSDLAKKDKSFSLSVITKGFKSSYRIFPSRHEEEYDFWYQVRDSILVYVDNKLTLKKPQKKSFPLATNKTRDFEVGEASICFSDDKIKEVYWNVPENNHACRDAHYHTLAKVLFGALSGITWTRGSGGEIVGNDEYNQEDCRHGGGANYAKYTYKFKSKQELAKSRSRTVSYSSGFGRYSYR